MGAYYQCAPDNTGRVAIWQDGVRLFDVRNVPTRHADGDCQWSVNNYSNGLTPSSATIYIDDAATAIPAAGTVSITASASDDVSVAGIQFLLNGSPLGPEDTTAPYAYDWSPTGAAGSHQITAVARDVAGNRTTSAAITVTVKNGLPEAIAPLGLTDRATSGEP